MGLKFHNSGFGELGNFPFATRKTGLCTNVYHLRRMLRHIHHIQGTRVLGKPKIKPLPAGVNDPQTILIETYRSYDIYEAAQKNRGQTSRRTETVEMRQAVTRLDRAVYFSYFLDIF